MSSTAASTEPRGAASRTACVFYTFRGTHSPLNTWEIASEIGSALKNIHLCHFNSFLVHMLQWKWWVNGTVCLISRALIVRWPIYRWLQVSCFNSCNGSDHIYSKQLVTGYSLHDALSIKGVMYDLLTTCVCSLQLLCADQPGKETSEKRVKLPRWCSWVWLES